MPQIKLKRSPRIVDESTFTINSLTNDVIKNRQDRYEKDVAERKYRDDGFHLSSYLSLPEGAQRYCGRELQLNRQLVHEIAPWKPEVDLQRIFDVGHKIHSLEQDYLKDLTYLTDNAGLYGSWKCRVCNNEWMDFSPRNCVKCKAGTQAIKYREYRFKSERWEIHSTTDGLLWVYNAHKNEWFEYILEFKSIKDRSLFFGGDPGFAELQEPIEKHVNQAQGYGHLRRLEHKSGKLGKLPKQFTKWPTFANKIIFIYVNKNDSRRKEFRVNLSKKAWKTITGRITAIQNANEAGSLLPRIGMCEDIESARKIAKCPLVEECFVANNKHNKSGRGAWLDRKK